MMMPDSVKNMDDLKWFADLVVFIDTQYHNGVAIILNKDRESNSYTLLLPNERILLNVPTIICTLLIDCKNSLVKLLGPFISKGDRDKITTYDYATLDPARKYIIYYYTGGHVSSVYNGVYDGVQALKLLEFNEKYFAEDISGKYLIDPWNHKKLYESTLQYTWPHPCQYEEPAHLVTAQSIRNLIPFLLNSISEKTAITSTSNIPAGSVSIARKSVV